jgi:pyruvate/2-oxoglutarate dehydrogenase complex dihydrolipoamide dehydrogenase (E3) component
VGPTTLAVGDETITGGHVVIAGGARHAPLGIPGEEHLTTSTAFLELDQLPPRVAFVVPARYVGPLCSLLIAFAYRLFCGCRVV